MARIKVCCICLKRFSGLGNSPRPVKLHGECCDNCNFHVVIPARVRELQGIKFKREKMKGGNKDGIIRKK